MTWQQAIDWCAGLGDGWRLPTVQELVGIVDYTRSDPAVIKPLADSTASGYYWSSTPDAGTPYTAWFVDFYFGYVYNGGKTSHYYVRAVRGAGVTP